MKYNLEKVLTAKTPEWLRAEASTPESDEGVDRIYIDGIIGGGWLEDGTTAHDFRMLAESLTAPTLEIHINSPGGSVDEGVAIYSYLASDPRKIVCVVDGMAASIASVILMAGDVIKINAAATIYVHKPWAVTVGNDAETRAASVELGRATTDLAKLYQARTGQTFRAVEDLMRGEEGADGTVIGAEEALRLGFADEIIPAKEGAPAMAALYIGFFDLAETTAEDEPEEEKPVEDADEPEKRRPCEGEAEEEEKPEEKPEPSTPAEPAEPTPDPESPSEEPGAAPDPAPAEEPEKKPDEGTAEESSEVEEEEKPEEEEAKAKAHAPTAAPAPRALRPAPQVEAAPAVSDWSEAVKVCGSYASARRKYPALYEDFMESHR